jgi:magnesium transporter
MLINNINEMTNEDLKVILEQMHSFDIAELFNASTEENKKRIIDVLSESQVSELITYLDPRIAADLISNLEIKEQKILIELMETDDAVDIIQSLNETEQNELLEHLEDNSEIKQLLCYEEFEAGAHMTSDIILLTPDLTVKEATKILIMQAKDVETISTLFVVDDETKYLGTLSFKKLIKAKIPLTVEDLYDKSPSFLDKTDISVIIQGIQHYGLYEVPITNEENKLLGMITIDDALDIYKEEAKEDFEKLSALPKTTKSNPFYAALNRLPWLVTLLILSIPIALVTGLFEDVLAAVVILAMFQPLILDAGGDVATQTLAVTLITLNNKSGRLFKNGYKEIITGLINGFVMAIIAFIVTYIFAKSIKAQHTIELSLIVSISLLFTVFLGPIIGFFVPVTLQKLKIDPAVASGPFITTLIDILSLFIYFGLATLILGGVINV